MNIIDAAKNLFSARRNLNKKSKTKRKVSNIMLVLICIMIISYTAANFILQYFTSVEVSPTLTDKWFNFWGVELIALTAIKTAKVIKGEKSTEEQIIEEEGTEE